jgi:hypothetical protein
LLQFVYRFPLFHSKERREARIILWISLLYPVGEGVFAIYRYAGLAQGDIRYRNGWMLVFLLVWLVFIMLRKVALVDQRPIPYWRKVYAPPDRIAYTARNFALLGLMPPLILGVSLLRDTGLISNSAGVALISNGVLLSLLLFVLVYVNGLPEQTSFLVKFVAVSLAFVLGITGTLGHIITPAFIANYYDHDAERLSGTALDFTPQRHGRLYHRCHPPPV